MRLSTSAKEIDTLIQAARSARNPDGSPAFPAARDVEGCDGADGTLRLRLRLAKVGALSVELELAPDPAG